jgi:hypothetical protein
MSLGRLLKSSFSPHGIAVMGLAVACALGLGGVAAVATGHVGGGLIVLLGTMVIALAFEEWSRCPACGKPPIVRQGHNRDRLVSMFARRHRWWPETTCSDCGTPLNVGQDD